MIFIARLTNDPNDIRVFGRAIGTRHVPGRDDATPADIARLTAHVPAAWLWDFPIYPLLGTGYRNWIGWN